MLQTIVHTNNFIQNYNEITNKIIIILIRITTTHSIKFVISILESFTAHTIKDLFGKLLIPVT